MAGPNSNESFRSAVSVTRSRVSAAPASSTSETPRISDALHQCSTLSRLQFCEPARRVRGTSLRIGCSVRR
jgi:hypothetical protein